MTLAQFVAPIDEVTTGIESTLPAIKLGQAAPRIAFDAIGHPRGNRWEPVSFPGMTDPAAFALEIIGDEFAPTYREGDLLVVSPTASVRRGDKVVVLAQADELILKQFRHKSARRVELTSLTGQGEPLLLGVSDIQWMSRIIWASQ
jgi:phage repressor protein C with HTH and peptisase S24 domain